MISRALFLVFIMLSSPAAASELLIFRGASDDLREQQVVREFTAQKHLEAALPFQIAPADLNGDGVDEWIIRQDPVSACAGESACRFTVAGLRDKRPAVLGAFEAGKVALSSEKAYGVRKLLVYNKKSDDFAYSVFVWDPHKGRFTAE